MEILVAVLGLGARASAGVHVGKTVALALGRIHAECRVVADRSIERTRHAERAVVADCQLAFDRRLVAGTTGDDIDHAGRRVLSEHGALRTLEYLDALDLT